MKKNYLWITAHGKVIDSSYFINLKDKKQMMEDLTDLTSKLVIFQQVIVKVDFVEERQGAW